MPTETNVHGDALCFMIMGPSLLQRLVVGGWWPLAAVRGWRFVVRGRLAVGGWWQLAAVGDWWRLAVGDGWQLAVPGGCPERPSWVLNLKIWVLKDGPGRGGGIGCGFGVGLSRKATVPYQRWSVVCRSWSGLCVLRALDGPFPVRAKIRYAPWREAPGTGKRFTWEGLARGAQSTARDHHRLSYGP